MSEAPAEQPTTETPTAPEAPAQETDWKAEARKWEDRAKQNSKAAERLAEFEEAQKTEAQKLAERAEAAEKRAAEFETQALRLSIASKYGVTGDYLDLIHGGDADALEASAQKVAKLIAAQTATPQKPQPLIVPAEGKTPVALNSSALEDSLRKAVGAN